jgi:hypothetical protein
MPPPGGSIPPEGGSIPPTTGEYAAASNPVSKALRLLKTQLQLAVGLREEDPERAWLEAVSVRERVAPVAEGASQDALLMADVERFKFKLEEAIRKLTRDVGDEVIAPLYSWVDLLRQRGKLDGEVETAMSRVAEARASRGAPTTIKLSTEEQATAALEAAEKELAAWQADVPPEPTAEAMAVWNELGGDALRPALPSAGNIIRSRGAASRVFLEGAHGRPLGESKYAGSVVEFLVLPSIGAGALLSSMFAFARSGPHVFLSALSVVACGSFGAAIVASVQARRRVVAERRAALDVVWHRAMYNEQAPALDLEVGWLRALQASLRARRAFDTHKGEGGQLSELSKWRPDLEPVVDEVAKSSLAPPPEPPPTSTR